MGLHHSYTLIAPIYDGFVAPFTASARRRSLALLKEESVDNALIIGVGSGLDIPLLPPGPRYVGLDLTPAMLKRAQRRLVESEADIRLELGDAGALPYADASFDAVIMHLILAVVPHSQQVLAEADRVLRPGGRILVLDKFLRPGQRAPVRRLMSPILGTVATRTNVVFEELLRPLPDLDVIEDHPALAGGWFRHIVVKKRA
jgi:ubiquinone/menaquinone biosynthesis C-methylase UbiE